MIKWDESLSVHHPEIDRQHKNLIDRVNELRGLYMTHDKQSNIQQMIDIMEGYAQEHFQFEEDYFNSFLFPDAKAHAQKHRDFEAKITELKTRLADEGVSSALVIHIAKFVSDWLHDHLITADQEYAAYKASLGAI
jgi:hemerythrin